MVRRGKLITTVRLLHIVRALTLALIPVTAGYFLWPRSSMPVQAGSTQTASESPSAPTDTVRDLAWYSPLWTRNLKEPPIASTIEKPPESKPPENLPVLLATLVEPEGSFAHFASPSGAPRLRGLNETIDRYRVTEIQPGRVRLEAGEKTVWVELPKPRN